MQGLVAHLACSDLLSLSHPGNSSDLLLAAAAVSDSACSFPMQQSFSVALSQHEQCQPAQPAAVHYDQGLYGCAGVHAAGCAG